MNEKEIALQKNYELGNYGIKYCTHCLQPIEQYKNISIGLCYECQESLL